MLAADGRRSTRIGRINAAVPGRLRFRLGLGMLAIWRCMSISGQECVTCHPAETKSHAATRMAHAMVAAGESGFGKNLPDRALREPGGGFEFTFGRDWLGVTMTAERGNERAQGTIEWVMGAGAQGQTPLVKTADGRTLESRISYFPQLGQYGITIGQPGGASASAGSALGVVQSARALAECVGCHSTSTSTSKEVQPGVQCERCHAGALEHAARGKGVVSNPGKMTARAQAAFCGGCHRLKAPVDDSQLENVRFQPLRLEKSRCFASGQLSCTTCHVAHQDARRNDATFYNAKCRSCHGGGAEKVGHVDARATGDCIGCHMPYVELHPALKFTDHYIRVVRAGDETAGLMRRR